MGFLRKLWRDYRESQRAIERHHAALLAAGTCPACETRPVGPNGLECDVCEHLELMTAP